MPPSLPQAARKVSRRSVNPLGRRSRRLPRGRRREVTWLFAKRLRPFVLLAAGASLVLNVALLMPALYMMQVFDRVFGSGSVETLVMLSLITLLFLGVGFCVDAARAR